MKKGDVIKRRKRVMPATATASPPTQHGAAPHHPDSSVSPDPAYPHSPPASSMAAPPPPALPMHPRDPALVLEPAFANNGPPPVDFTSYSRKRAFGDADAAGALSGESIDPGLGVAAAAGAAETKAQVRARLQRERLAMREKLRAVESELARMEEDG